MLTNGVSLNLLLKFILTIGADAVKPNFILLIGGVTAVSFTRPTVDQTNGLGARLVSTSIDIIATAGPSAASPCVISPPSVGTDTLVTGLQDFTPPFMKNTITGNVSLATNAPLVIQPQFDCDAAGTGNSMQLTAFVVKKFSI